ncbi:MAG: phage tail sheath family protein [bacterium]
MPVPLTAPGVYIQEVSSGVRTITGVATSITAFVGNFSRGPTDRAVQVLSFSEFEQVFGGLSGDSEASYAVFQFFQNGGSEAWICRAVGAGADKASLDISNSISGSPVLTITAKSEGAWGNDLHISINDPPADDITLFNLGISLVQTIDGKRQIIESERFLNLSMDKDHARFVEKIISDPASGSLLINAEGKVGKLPLPTGTLSGQIDLKNNAIGLNDAMVRAMIDGEGSSEVKLGILTSEQAKDLTVIRKRLEEGIRASRPEKAAFSQARVEIYQNDRLRILAGSSDPKLQIRFEGIPADNTAQNLGLLGNLETRNCLLSGAINFPVAAGSLTLNASGTSNTIALTGPSSDLKAAAQNLQQAIQVLPGGNPAFAKAAVMAVEDSLQLLIVPGDNSASFTISQSGTDPLSANLGFAAATPRLGTLSDKLPVGPTPINVAKNVAVNVTIGLDGPHEATFTQAANTNQEAADRLQEAIREAHPGKPPSFLNAVVLLHKDGSDERMLALPGTNSAQVSFIAPASDPNTVGKLKLDAAGQVTENVQDYKLGSGAVSTTAQIGGKKGENGGIPDVDALRAAMHLLDHVDLFNILCIPNASIVNGNGALTPEKSLTLLQTASNYCLERRAVFLVDPPNDPNPSIDSVRNWLTGHPDLRSRNAAIYFPRLKMADPLNDYRLREVGPCGTIAGLMARTDSERGVWKAPAGTEATLRNMAKFTLPLNDSQNGVLNPLAINCLRTFPSYGKVCWGARTLDGNDQKGSEWKYLPVRRLALFLEESLFRGTQWVVFEPNDEPLWAQIRLNIGAFMQNLFRQGAFQGSSPREAYYVKCDRETTTQNDINLGIVNIHVGFAPLKPAEFVVIRFQQMAGQITT